MTRRVALVVVLVASLAAVAAVGAANAPTNPASLPTGLAAGPGAESSALYCTGLTSARGGAEGRVVFLNTTRRPRVLSVTVVATGAHSASRSVTVAPRATASLSPSSLVAGAVYGVSAVVDGGGVLADEVTDSGRSEAPCAPDGVTQWFGSGFDSSVGSSATLSFFNPTATPAVVNVTAFTPTGFAAPAAFQGLAVGGHAEVTIDLGRAVVNVGNFGARVNVVRGALVVAGVEDSNGVGSIDGGAGAAATTSVFPAVTTAARAVAQIRLADPGPIGARVTLTVALGGFQVPAISLSVPAYGEAEAVITPNSSIPAAGLARVSVSASEPVVATLADGSSSDVALTPAFAPTGLVLLGGFDPSYGHLLVANASARDALELRVVRAFTVAGCAASPPPAGVGSLHLSAGAVADAQGASAGPLVGPCRAAVVQASRPDLVVAEVLPSTPAGVSIVSGSAG